MSEIQKTVRLKEVSKKIEFGIVPEKFFKLSLIATALLASNVVWAADSVVNSTSGDTTFVQNDSGLTIFDNVNGGIVGLNPGAGFIGVTDASGAVIISTVASDFGDGSLTVGGGVSISNINAGVDALQVTGNSTLTGALTVTNATTLNSSGVNQIAADGTSARMVSGSNNVTVDTAKVGLAFSDGTISSSILMQDPGAGSPGGVAILATGAVGSGVEASVLVDNGAVTNGLKVRANETTLSGGQTASSTTLTLNDTGFKVTGVAGDTFSVSNAGAAILGNNGLAGSLAIANGVGGNAVLLNGVANTITGSTSTAVSGGSTTLTVNNAGVTLNDRQIKGLADGSDPTDAVNVRQLNALSSNNTARFNAIDSRIDNLSERAYAGIASVAALAAVPSPAVGKKYSVGLGVGNYQGENAFAVGFRGAVTDSVSVTVGVSQNSASKTAANAGVGFSW